ncbi:MAG TPA: CpsD/CapB family tyrosine-protein kinase [Ktedonobacteraceae bacterium]
MGNLFRYYLLSVRGKLWSVLLCTLLSGAAMCLPLTDCALLASARLRTVPAPLRVLAPIGEVSLSLQRSTAGEPFVHPGTLRAGTPTQAFPVLVLPGAVLALLLALFAAAFLIYRGRRPGSVEQMREVLGMQIVAQVPRFSRPTRRAELPPASAQIYASVCASLQGLPGPLKLVMFASAQAGEGKSTLVSEVAISLARAGRRVLLVDLHVRHPGIAPRFGLSSRAGLTDMLAACHTRLPLEQYCQTCAFAGLHVLAAGTCRMKPLELLRALTAAQFFPRLRQTPFDYVLFDTPPLFPATATQILASLGEALVLVVHGSRTPRRVLARTRRLLARMPAISVVGVMVNQPAWRDCPGLPAEEATRQLPVVSTQARLPDTDTGHLPDTGETRQIGRVSTEHIIRPPISLCGLMGTTNGLLGRVSGTATPLPSSLREPEQET